MDRQQFAERFGYYHHSPSAVQKPLEIDIFQKHLRRQKAPLHFGSPVAVGRAVEAYAAAMLIDGQGAAEASRHAMTELDAHELVPWDREADRARLDIHRDIITTIGEHAREGLAQALTGANQITGQERHEAHYPGLLLKFMGFSDFFGANRVAELKTKTSSVAEKAKSGRRAGPLPSKPEAKHVQQVAFYADVIGCEASLVYASESGFRVFDETNCDELTPEGIKKAVNELRARAWSRENIMRLAPSSTTLMQMLSPDWSDWGWKMAPEQLAQARAIWGL